MNRALLIPVEGEIEWVTVGEPDAVRVNDDPSTLESLQALVGGYIEAIEVPVSNAGATVYLTGYLNEEGKLKELPENENASYLAQGFLFPEDYIAGPLVLLGPPDDEGNDTDAPEWLLDGVRNFLR